MGVHYFFTWVTNRYALIKRQLQKESLPNVDHLYLDINGVLYNCAKDSSAVFKDLLSGKKMNEIYINIINYLNMIISLIKPKKT